ncbi:SDR family oxidoreductase [Candidatus Poribacteria bacterium]|nr:SDR family oxidoreductase [Candidatus Poribacteria bacterium]
MQNLFDLSGRVAVVTGAGGAMGNVIAVGLATYGADVVVVGHKNKERMSKTLSQIRSLGRKALEIYCDVASQQDVDRLLKATLDEFGHADILVNGAGYTFRTDAPYVNIEDWEKLMAVNLTGAFRCAQAFGKGMIERKKGSIINISSISGMVALGRGQAAYCSSKHGLIGMTRELAIEWGPFNVRVNAIAPCQVATEGLLKWIETSESKGELYDGRPLRKHLISQIPLGRFAEPEEYIGPTVFLASDASSMVTGHVLAVDGGYLAR